MDTFTTFQIMKILGLPRERLKDWMDKGYVIPSIRKADGVGTKNIFDLVDVYGIALFMHFLSQGLIRTFAAEYTRSCLALIRDKGRHWLSYKTVLVMAVKALNDFHGANFEKPVLNSSNKRNYRLVPIERSQNNGSSCPFLLEDIFTPLKKSGELQDYTIMSVILLGELIKGVDQKIET